MLRYFIILVMTLGLAACVEREVAFLPSQAPQELDNSPSAKDEICKAVGEKEKAPWERFQNGGSFTTGVAFIGSPTGALNYLREVLDSENIRGDFAVECDDTFFIYLPQLKKPDELKKKLIEKFKKKDALLNIQEVLEFSQYHYSAWIEKQCEDLERCKEIVGPVPKQVSCQLAVNVVYRKLPKKMTTIERLARCAALPVEELACLIHNPQSENVDEEECRAAALKKFE